MFDFLTTFFTAAVLYRSIAFAIPLVLLGLGLSLRLFPNRYLVLLCVLPMILAIVVAFVPNAAIGLWVVDGLLVAVAMADALSLPRRKAFSVERQMNRVASLGKTHPVSLTISNLTRRSYHIWMRDDAASELRPEPDEFEIELGEMRRATVHYELRPARRGAFSFERVYVRVRSRLGFWRRYLDYSMPALVHVYPDMKQLSQYALLARLDRLNLLGMRQTRKIGQDNEFERLRDYTADDNFKHIDWRSTARRRKLTVKDFQANQSQRLLFLVDCGRMMLNESKGLSFLDHALNSMLMLSYVALRHGDAVGLACFSNDIHCYLPPHGGMNQMNRLLHASFDRFPHLVESRYDKAFLYLGSHCRKRTLVILITNVIDEVNGGQVQEYLSNLVGKHLPLGVLLRDRSVFDMADHPQPHGPQLYEAAAAAEILLWRHQVLSDLNRHGVLSVDVFPDDLTAPLINRYLEIKARHLL